jgi:hypothetical protein
LALISSFSSAERIRATGRNELTFTVHYCSENEFFDDSRRPFGTYYLLSYTDYIEINNNLKVDLNENVSISYIYTVTETLFFRYNRSTNNNTNPIVYEEKNTFVELSGSINNGSALLNGSNDKANGSYIVYPREYIETYRQFIENHREQSERNLFLPDKSISFSAELLVEFSYILQADGNRQTVTRGIRIPISAEVYNPEYVGESNFSILNSAHESESASVSRIIPALWFFANLGVIFFVNRRFFVKQSRNKNEAVKILKKYSDEIFIAESPPDYTGYKIIHAPQFKELLKLAVNMNKYILCFHNDKKAEFCVHVDNHAFCYILDYKL